MTVTKQTYTAAPTWTAAQLATIFQNAFVDAGLMTAWYDSFVNSGIEHRILEIIYDGTKTYGKTYYWFTFTSTIGISVASGWNATTHVPTGTQYVDYYATATNTQANHLTFRSGLTTGTAVELVRYTDSGYSWFALRNGAAPSQFFIAPASTGLPPWIDLNKVFFHHFIIPTISVASPTGSGRAVVEFTSAYFLRRSLGSGFLRGLTTVSNYIRTLTTLGYVSFGNGNNNTDNYIGYAEFNRMVLVPYGFNNTNPAYTTNYTPVINGYSYSNYTTSNMPADFGIFFNYGPTAFAFGDRIVVSAGVEEWEVYGFANNTSFDIPSALIVARVV